MNEIDNENPSTEIPLPAETVEPEHEENLENRYAQLQKKYELLQRQNLLEKVSGETGCTDPEYLEFCALRRQINVDDPDALRKFARELAAVSPGCFTARITPGSNAGSPQTSPAASAAAEEFSGDRISMIAMSVSNAPDVGCR